MAKRYYVHAQKAHKKRKWLLVLGIFILAAGFSVVPVYQALHNADAVPAAAPPEASPLVTPLPLATPPASPTSIPTPTPAPLPIEDDGSGGYLSGGLYLWKDRAFELFYGGTGAAKSYAAAISSYREKLGDRAVYNMVVPNHSEFGLPERIREEMGCTSQRENTLDVYENYTADVQAVDIYDALDQHKNEYLYFNTDTHWAPLGAYYAYLKFCEVSGVEAAPLSGFDKTTVEDFTGYLYAATEEACLRENPDHVDLYEPQFSYTAELSQDGESFEDLGTVNSPDESMGYSMFIWGDNPCVRIANEDMHTGRNLAFVKDSYGNAMAPFLAASFDQVYVIDFRSFPQNLASYCEEKGITDVLFLNNVMSANTASQIETMDQLFS